MSEFHGIDISRWQKNCNYDLIAKSVDFVLIKAGGSDAGFYRDSMFENHYKHLHEYRHVPCGAYYFVGKDFYGTGSGVADAVRFLDIIKGKKFEYPIALDIETTQPGKKTLATDAAIAFCETLENAGYYVVIYASDISGFQDRLEIERLEAYDKWVARYGSKPKYVRKYGIWQSSSKGIIPGINGNCDLDHAYYDYEKIIKNAHLNGF